MRIGIGRAHLSTMRRWLDRLPIILHVSLLAACGSSAGGGVAPDGGAATDAGVVPDGGVEPDGGVVPDGGAACGEGIPLTPGRVRTDRGVIEGIAAGDGVWSWLGVPYAAPPTGSRRWRPPEDLACEPEVRVAASLPPRCPQLEAPPAGDDPVVVGDEDCLFLNVWAPQEAADTPRPVLVFLHGGGNVQGSAVEEVGEGALLYDGAHLARTQDVVVVVPQYRLGPLGFLAHPDLTTESEDRVSGNYGILDQIAALEWVARNAAAFGGDAGRVLVFGESAGAVDTCVLLASPRAEGLFSAALMQSGGCNQRPLDVAEDEGLFWADEAGCGEATDVPDCLRGLPVVDALLAVPASISVIGGPPPPVDWRPNVDGVVLPRSPFDAMRAGTSHPVPVIVGSNTDETSRDAPPIADTDEAYRAALRGLGVGDVGATLIMGAYPRETYGSARAALIQVTTDARFTCGAREAARAQAAGHPGVPVYRYLFGQRLEGGSPLLEGLGAWHGLELLFLFGVLDAGGYAPTDADRAVSAQLGAYWAAFAADGAPSPEGFPTWPRYEEPDEPLLFIAGETPEAIEDPRRDRCDFWASLAGG